MNKKPLCCKVSTAVDKVDRICRQNIPKDILLLNPDGYPNDRWGFEVKISNDILLLKPDG